MGAAILYVTVSREEPKVNITNLGCHPNDPKILNGYHMQKTDIKFNLLIDENEEWLKIKAD